jgi:outer membrane protein assembly factor BamD
MPPGAERDQTQVRQAIATYEDLLARYPSAEAAELARTHLDACRAKLAEHELYVARFYFGRQQWAGAVGRAETLLHQYGGLGLDAEALFMLGQARMAQGKIRQGRSALEQLVADHPDSRFARRVPKLLAGGPKAADIE